MPNGRDHDKELRRLSHVQSGFHRVVEKLESRLEFYIKVVWRTFNRIVKEYRKARSSLSKAGRKEGDRLLKAAREARAEFKQYQAFIKSMKREIKEWVEILENQQDPIGKIHIHEKKIALLIWVIIYLQRMIWLVKAMIDIFIQLRKVARGK